MDEQKETLRVGSAVRRRRRQLELTLAVVAERSGLSVPFLSQVENERARPSRRSLQRVADALLTTDVELLAAADPACTVDLMRAGEGDADGPPPTPGYAIWSAATISCTPSSSPATTTRAASSSTGTTS